jgi:hypothetical protein
LAAARSVPDDAPDDFIPLYPLEPPNMSVNVIYIKLDGSHVAAVETNTAKLLRVAKLHPIEGSKRLELSSFRKLNRRITRF